MIIKRFIYRVIQKHRKRKLKSCGLNVTISKGCDLRGNIFISNDVVIGENCRFVSTIANLDIKDHVVFGPDVTIYTGDHRFDVIGKYIKDIDDSAKTIHNDKDVIIDSDCWIGTRTIILKGVHIGKGCVIGAGAVVTKSIPPYSIYVGVPSAKIRSRFTEEQIIEHEKMLYKQIASKPYREEQKRE